MEGWSELSKIWNDLLIQSRSDNIFLTWEWLYTWGECFLKPDREIFILSVYKGNELLGIAPWCIRQVRFGLFTLRQIEFLGIPEGGSDYLDVFAMKGKEKEVALSIYNFLFHQAPSRWDILHLQEVPANSLFLLHFLDKIGDAGKYMEIQPGAFCPVAVLADTPHEFFNRLSANRRGKFMRDWRILNKAGKTTHTTITPVDSEYKKALESMYLLYSSRWNHSLNESFIEKFVSRVSKKGWVQIDFINVDGRDIAGLFHLKYKDIMYMYLMAVDRDFNPAISLGNILVGLCIEKAIEEKFTTYDFLKGNEAYKFHWAGEGKRSLKISLYQNRFLVIPLILGKFLKHTAKIILR